VAIVSSSTDVPPTRICAGVNVLLNATAGATFTVSVVGCRRPVGRTLIRRHVVRGDRIDVRARVVLVTLTVIVHVAPAPTLPPSKATLVPPDGRRKPCRCRRSSNPA